MKIKSKLATLIVLTAISRSAICAPDEFSNIKCGMDIKKSLIGNKIASNESSEKSELKHKDIKLKFLGSDESDINLYNSNISICDREYFLLYDRNVIRDVLEVPQGGRSHLGQCKAGGNKLPGEYFVVVTDKSIRSAWVISRKKGYSEIPTKDLHCKYYNPASNEYE
jgi:hypothetical protein